jgi:uncharacterized protein
MATRDRYRILSLDGGGVWALIEVLALMEIFGRDAPGREVLRSFDLVAGNSAGSLVIAGMLEYPTLEEVYAIFLDPTMRARLFKRRAWWHKVANPLTIWFGPRWSTRAKLAGLRSLLPQQGDTPMDALPALIGRAESHVMLIAFDYDRARAVFFRSDRASRAANFTLYQPTPLVLAACASSDAPVRYFDRPIEIPDAAHDARRYWDGGVGGYNNPVLAAVVEALANGRDASAIDALSIGTGSTTRPRPDPGVPAALAAPREDPGFSADLSKIAGAILDEPPDAATFIAHVALGQRLPSAPGDVVSDGAIVRMNPVACPLWTGAGWELPKTSKIDPEQFVKLTSLDMDLLGQRDVLLVEKFAKEWIADVWPNQAIRAGQDFSCEIGHARFSDALRAWRGRTGG